MDALLCNANRVTDAVGRRRAAGRPRPLDVDGAAHQLPAAAHRGRQGAAGRRAADAH